MIKKGDQPAEGRERKDIYGEAGWRDGKGENNVPLMQSQVLAEGPAPISLSLQVCLLYIFHERWARISDGLPLQIASPWSGGPTEREQES